MSIYDVDYSLVIDRLSPPKKRQPIYLAWLNALLAPVKDLHISIFTTYRDDIILRLKYNSQRIKLEKTLNDNFNPGNADKIYLQQNQKRIYGFHTSESGVLIYGYKADEVVSPTLINYGYHYNETQYVDFIINIPDNITISEPALRALVDALIFTGKTYSITYYTP